VSPVRACESEAIRMAGHVLLHGVHDHYFVGVALVVVAVPAEVEGPHVLCDADSEMVRGGVVEGEEGLVQNGA